ncbi:MAG: hypothetical protein AVDCRST_MAG73-1004, partial [uncultured Thermomicrobiales bacterium]
GRPPLDPDHHPPRRPRPDRGAGAAADGPPPGLAARRSSRPIHPGRRVPPPPGLPDRRRADLGRRRLAI